MMMGLVALTHCHASCDETPSTGQQIEPDAAPQAPHGIPITRPRANPFLRAHVDADIE